MPIDDFELMHGAVITKICRNDRPIALTLIESRDKHRAAYWLNDLVLYIKYCTTPRKSRGGKTSWRFTFQPEHIADLVDYSEQTEVYLALVCGHHKLNERMEICLLYPDEVTQCLDFSLMDTQWIAVEEEPRKRLRAFGPLNNREDSKLIIERNRVDKWEVPGR